MGYIDVFLMPLYGGALNLSATEIGTLVGARSVLPVFLSIHVGTLMDRFGTRRVTMVFAAVAIGCAPLIAQAGLPVVVVVALLLVLCVPLAMLARRVERAGWTPAEPAIMRRDRSAR